MGYGNPLQTTPKSVVDGLGRGSFRAHSATQVLATRWDMLQEENGFPANRQFYILEDGQQIFTRQLHLTKIFYLLSVHTLKILQELIIPLTVDWK